MKGIACPSAACLALTLVISPVPSLAQGTDFKGKTLEILVGFSAGGGYDAYGRALAQYLGKHLTDNPTVVVRNMPGAALFLRPRPKVSVRFPA